MAPRAAALAAEWAPLAGRVLLGLVLGWFGYHELVQPSPWTGYVPALSPASSDRKVLWGVINVPTFCGDSLGFDLG
jgi:hypothetical protein